MILSGGTSGPPVTSVPNQNSELVSSQFWIVIIHLNQYLIVVSCGDETRNHYC